MYICTEVSVQTWLKYYTDNSVVLAFQDAICRLSLNLFRQTRNYRTNIQFAYKTSVLTTRKTVLSYRNSIHFGKLLCKTRYCTNTSHKCHNSYIVQVVKVFQKCIKLRMYEVQILTCTYVVR